MPWLVRSRRRRRPGKAKARILSCYRRNCRIALETATSSSSDVVSIVYDSDADWESASNNDSDSYMHMHKQDDAVVNPKPTSRLANKIQADRDNAWAWVQKSAMESATKGGSMCGINSSKNNSSNRSNITAGSNNDDSVAGKHHQTFATASLSSSSSSNLAGKKGSSSNISSSSNSNMTFSSPNGSNNDSSEAMERQPVVTSSSNRLGGRKGGDNDNSTISDNTKRSTGDKINSGGSVSSSSCAIVSTGPSMAGMNRERCRPPNRRSNAATATVAVATTASTVATAATAATSIASSIVKKGHLGGTVDALGASTRRAKTVNTLAAKARRATKINDTNDDPPPFLHPIPTEQVDSNHPCYSPETREQFESLYDALQRNHPLVKCFSNKHALHFHPHRLGAAVLGNTVVSELYLYKNHSIAYWGAHYRAINDPFLFWLEQNRALTTVKIFKASVWENDRRLRDSKDAAIRRILNAMAKNPSIRCFQSNRFYLTPLNVVSTFVEKAKQLQTLSLFVDEETDDEESERSDMEAAAHVFGKHAALKTLEISCNNLEPFLQQWHSLTSPSTHPLAGVTNLCLEFRGGREFDVSSAKWLSVVLSRMAKLERVALNRPKMDHESWAKIWSGLQSNPSIVDLALRLGSCTEEAASLITKNLGSNDATVAQHIRKLDLADNVFCSLKEFGGKQVARMLCGSLLDHVTLRIGHGDPVAKFFDSLIAKASTARLSSMVLKAKPESMPHLERFLPAARYLRHLSVEASDDSAWYSPGGNWRSPDRELSVSSEFLKSLRRNGSLETFKISGRYGGHVNDRSLLRINTYTTRNREMHELLQPSSMALAEDAEHEPHEIPPALKLFPTLVVRGALPAETMAPHAVLKGLVNALEATGPQFDNDDPL